MKFASDALVPRGLRTDDQEASDPSRPAAHSKSEATKLVHRVPDASAHGFLAIVMCAPHLRRHRLAHRSALSARSLQKPLASALRRARTETARLHGGASSSVARKSNSRGAGREAPRPMHRHARKIRHYPAELAPNDLCRIPRAQGDEFARAKKSHLTGGR